MGRLKLAEASFVRSISLDAPLASGLVPFDLDVGDAIDHHLPASTANCPLCDRELHDGSCPEHGLQDMRYAPAFAKIQRALERYLTERHDIALETSGLLPFAPPATGKFSAAARVAAAERELAAARADFERSLVTKAEGLLDEQHRRTGEMLVALTGALRRLGSPKVTVMAPPAPPPVVVPAPVVHVAAAPPVVKVEAPQPVPVLVPAAEVLVPAEAIKVVVEPRRSRTLVTKTVVRTQLPDDLPDQPTGPIKRVDEVHEEIE